MSFSRATLGLAILTLGAFGGPASAASYPDRPVRIVAGTGPGAAMDLFARTLGQQFQERLGQPFIIENKAGAAGNIAAEFVAKSPADGYTVMIMQGGITAAPFLQKNPRFDPLKDFEPIGVTAIIPAILVVPSSSPVKTFADFVAYAKSRSGAMTYSSAGFGSPQHLLTETLGNLAGFKAVHVPYPGGNAMINAVVSQQVDFLLATPNSTEFVKSGHLRVIAVGSRKRLSDFADVPSISEFLPEYEANYWFGLVAPAGTPAEITRLLSEQQKTALERSRGALSGYELIGGTPDEMRQRMSAETEVWRKVVKDSGIEPN